MINLKKSYAFTLMELLITLSVIGVLIAITITGTKYLTPDVDKARFKKAYTTVEKTVTKLINDDDVYPDDMGFMNLSSVITDLNESFGLEDGRTKFRDAFKYLQNTIKDDLDCPMLSVGMGKCFMTDDGVVWGIPDTDFNSKGVVQVDGITYAPITIYTNWEKLTKSGGVSTSKMDDNAFFIGVKYDGNIRILNNITCTSLSQALQCKAVEFLKSETIKRTK